MNSKTAFLTLVLSAVLTVAAAAQAPLAGIGALLVNSVTGPAIHSVRAGSPAEKASLTKGFIISAVNGESTAKKKLDDCVKMIRGAAGTPVELGLIDPEDGSTRKLTLVREKIDVTR